MFQKLEYHNLTRVSVTFVTVVQFIGLCEQYEDMVFANGSSGTFKVKITGPSQNTVKASDALLSAAQSQVRYIDIFFPSTCSNQVYFLC